LKKAKHHAKKDKKAFENTLKSMSCFYITYEKEGPNGIPLALEIA
jgi:hypothetical protein